MNDLLARIEAAEGPSREIDLALANLLVFSEPHRLISSLVSGWSHDFAYPESELPLGGDEYHGWAKALNHMIAQPVERYTSSIDAALALCERVLPKWEILLTDEGETGSTSWIASIGPRETFMSYEAKGRTPSLALLAALLKAKDKTP